VFDNEFEHERHQHNNMHTETSCTPPDTLLLRLAPDVSRCVQLNWRHIRSSCRRGQLLTTYNFRLLDLTVKGLMCLFHRIFHDQTDVYKTNFSFGVILRHRVTGEVRHHPAECNDHFLYRATTVKNREDLETIKKHLETVDLIEHIIESVRDSYRTVIEEITNVEICLYKIGLQRIIE
jgi:hypothetical protein